MSTLSDEILLDPLGRGYSTMSDEDAAGSLNTPNRSRNRITMSGREVQAQIVDSEYVALTVEKKSQLLALTSSSDLDPFGFPSNVVKDIFGVGATSLSNLATARIETISRAREIGLGIVKVGHIAEARLGN